MLGNYFRKTVVNRSVRNFYHRHYRQLKAAVVLSGTGIYDGTETTEAVGLMVALAKRRSMIQYFAPDMEQTEVINHVTGERMEETRNVLVESARLTRGDVQPLEALNASNFDAVFFPGGFG